MALDILGPANAPNSTTARPPDDRSFGTTDTWFKDCSSSVANDGTKLKAAFMNAVSGAFRALIRGNGNTALAAPIVAESNADNMALLSVQYLIQRGQNVFAADSGVASALAGALSPAAPEYKVGMPVRLKVAATNTGPATINLNGLGVKSIVRPDGSPLQPGDLAAGEVAELVYDGISFQLQSVTPAMISSLAPAENLLLNPEFLVCTGNYDFPVAGVPTTTFAMTAGQMIYDGWRAGATGCTIVIGANGYITITGVLEQVIEAPYLAGEDVLVCADDVSGGALPVVLSDGVSLTVSSAIPAGAGPQGSGTIAAAAGMTGNVIVQFGAAAQTRTFRRPRLIRGNKVRPYVRRPAPAERSLCAQYLYQPGVTLPTDRRVDPATYANAAVGIGQAISATQAIVFVPFHSRMYKTPSLEVVNPSHFTIWNSAASSTLNATAIVLNGVGSNRDGALLLVTCASGLNAGDAVVMRWISGPNARLIFHAEMP